MPISLTISCAMCGKQFPDYYGEGLAVDTLETFTVEHLRKKVEAKRWIIQINEPHIDTYCSKKCAE